MDNIFFYAYLSKNLGDDLFVQVVANRYPNIKFTVLAGESYQGLLPDNVILGLDSNYYRKEKRDKRILKKLSKFHLPTRLLYPEFLRNSYQTLYSQSKKSDLGIYVIGSAFMENDRYRITSYLADYLYYKEHPIVLSCNFGPYHSEGYLKKHRKLLSMAKDVCWRDTESYSLFSKLPNMRRHMDIVFNYNLGEEPYLPTNFGDYVVISVVSPDKSKTLSKKNVDYINFLIQVIEECRRQSLKVVLAGFCEGEGDAYISKQILSKLSNTEDIIAVQYPELNYKEMMGIFSNSKKVITARYHAMVIGLLYQKPTHIIAYSDKTINVINDIDPAIRYIDTRNLEGISAKDFVDNFGYQISDERIYSIKKSANEQFLILDRELRN